MAMTRQIIPEEVRKAKLLLGKGLNVTEVANIIGRSVSAVIRIRDGAYDFLLAECQESPQDDGRMDILLKSIDSRLYRQNEDMKKAIAQLEGLNTAFVGSPERDQDVHRLHDGNAGCPERPQEPEQPAG